VNDPRGLLKEFGVDVGDKEVRVWDSSSEMRYFVIPERPAGAENLSEDELAELVTRDSMIGTGLPKPPEREAREGPRRGSARRQG
jgi:nitrile hydratase